MAGLSASVVVLAILLGVLLVVVFDGFCLLHIAHADTANFLPKIVWAVLVVCVSPIGGLVYLLAQRLPKRLPGPPPRKPVNRWIGIGCIVLVLLVIGLWTGIKSASNPQPQPAVPPPCPTGAIFAPVQELCPQLSGRHGLGDASVRREMNTLKHLQASGRAGVHIALAPDLAKTIMLIFVVVVLASVVAIWNRSRYHP